MDEMEVSFLDDRSIISCRSTYIEADRKMAGNFRLAENEVNPEHIVHLEGSSTVVYGGVIERTLKNNIQGQI
jgi:hypothetical protein